MNIIDNYPKKEKAVRAVRNAIRRGEIKKPKICSKCNREKNLQGHHYKGYKEQFYLDIV